MLHLGDRKYTIYQRYSRYTWDVGPAPVCYELISDGGSMRDISKKSSVLFNAWDAKCAPLDNEAHPNTAHQVLQALQVISFSPSLAVGLNLRVNVQGYKFCIEP